MKLFYATLSKTGGREENVDCVGVPPAFGWFGVLGGRGWFGWPRRRGNSFPAGS